MTSKKKLAVKRKPPAQKDDSLIDKIIDETIERHTGEAQKKEAFRLGPRRRVAKSFLTVLENEMTHRSNGLRMKPDKVAEIAERLAKDACKAVGLEPQGKKEKEE